MRVKGITSVFLILLLAITPITSAQPFPKEMRLKLNLYSPCKVKLEYEYTKNITISDVTSLGPSLYEVTHSPIDFRFQASDVDLYSFTLELDYEVRTIQILKLTIFSGSQPPSTMEIPVEMDRVVVRFEITVQFEPKYPSIDEITESVIQHLLGQLDIYHSENQRIYLSLQEALAVQSYLVAVNVIGLIIVGVIVYMGLRRTGEEKR